MLKKEVSMNKVQKIMAFVVLLPFTKAFALFEGIGNAVSDVGHAAGDVVVGTAETAGNLAVGAADTAANVVSAPVRSTLVEDEVLVDEDLVKDPDYAAIEVDKDNDNDLDLDMDLK